MSRSIRNGGLLVAAALAACSGGCAGAAGGDLYSRLQSEDPTVRAQAAVEAGREGDRRALSYLIDRLGDPESAVRLVAAVSLRRLTGRSMGYRHYDPPAERAEAVERWRRWLEARQGIAQAREGGG